MKTNKAITKEQHQEARSWLKKYNDSGYLGGNRMLALEAGMSYKEWMDLPAMIRSRKRTEITSRKRRIAGR